MPVELAAGQIVYPPPGQFIINTGSNSVLEWFDQAYQIWRPLIPASSAGQVTVDGFNWRLRNTTSSVSVASFTAGSGATNGIGQAATGVTLAVSAPGANGRQATLFPIVGGQVNNAALTSVASAALATPGNYYGGSGLLMPPLLVCSPPPPGGVTLLLTCTISGGAINSITFINQGAGYTSVPTVTVIPQLAGYAGMLLPSPAVQNVLGGANMPAIQNILLPFQWDNTGVFSNLPVISLPTALLGSGTLTGVGVIEPGALYTGTPTCTVTGAGAATVTLNAVVAAAADTCYLQPGVTE
jgi:hypothetical protein